MTKNNSGVPFMKKIFLALLLVSSIASTAWGQSVSAVSINGGSTPGTGATAGIGVIIGSNGQIQIYRRNIAQTYRPTDQPVDFDGTPSSGSQNSSQDLLNGIFLSVGNPSGGQQDLFGPYLNRAPFFGMRSDPSIHYVDWVFTSAPTPVTNGNSTTATTTYTATSSGGCTYTLSAVWNYVKPRDYITVTYNVALTSCSGSGDDGKVVRLYHLIDTNYTKGSVTNDNANPFSLPTASCPQGALGTCPTIGGASDQTQIVEAFRLRKDLCPSCSWESFYTGISSSLFGGNAPVYGPASPGNGPFIPAPFGGSSPQGIVDATNGDHAMGMTWKVGTVSGGSMPSGQFIQDILFQDSQTVTQKNVGLINGSPYAGGVTTDSNGVRSTTGQALSVGSTIQYQLYTTHNTWTGGAGGNALNVTLRETVPVGTTYSGGAGEGWTCAPSNNAGSVCTKTISFVTGDGTPKNTPFTVTVTSLPTSPATIDNTLVADVCSSAIPCPQVPSEEPGNCKNGDPQQCRIIVPLVAAPQLAIAKSATGSFTSPQTAGAAGAGVYTFTVTNNGTAAYNDSFVLSDTLPSGFTYDNAGHPMTGPAGYTISCDASTTTPKCTVTQPSGGLAPGATLTFTMPVNVAANTTVNGVVNYVSVVPCVGPACSNVTPPDCKVTPMPANCAQYTIPSLTIKKSATGTFTSPQTAGAAGAGIYTFTVTNSGTAAYNDSFVLTDTLPPGFSYDNAGHPVTGPAGYTISCDASTTTPKCTVTQPSGGLAPGATLTFTMPVNVAANTTVNGVVNYVSVVPSPPNCVGPACSNVTPPDCKVTPMPANCAQYTIPGLTIKKNATGTFTSPQTAGAAGAGAYTFTVTNNSTGVYNDSFVLSDTLPSGFTYDNAGHPVTGPAGYTISCDASTTTPKCTVTQPSGGLASGATLTFTMPVNVAANTTVNSAVNYVSVVPCVGPACSNVTPPDCKVTPMPANCAQYTIPGLTIKKSATGTFTSPQTAGAAGAGAYTFTVTNSTTVAFNGSFVLTDTLPSGFTYDNAGHPVTGPAGYTISCDASTTTPKCTVTQPSGGLAPGATLTFTMPVNVAANTTVNNAVNYVSVVPSPPNCVGPACSNVTPPDCKVTPMPANCAQYTIPGLTIKKNATGTFTSPQTAGAAGAGAYIFTVTNSTTVAYNGSFVLSDTLPSGFSYDNAGHPVTGPAGYTISCDASTTTPKCTVTQPSGGLAPGATLTFTMPVNVAANTTVNNAVNYVSVVPSPPNCVGPTCGNVTPPDCKVTPMPANCAQYTIPGLTIKKNATGTFASPQTAGAAGAGVYTFTVTNSGTVTYNGSFVLTDTLPPGFSYDNVGHPMTVPAGYAVSCDSSTTAPKCVVTQPPGGLAPGAALTFTMPVNVAANTTLSNAVNYVSVVPSPPNCVGPTCGNVTPPDCTATPMPANCAQYTIPGFTVKKSAIGIFTSPQTAGAPGAGVYTFAVMNSSTVPYNGSFVLNDPLPAGFSYDNAGHPMTGPAGYAVSCDSSTTAPKCVVTPPVGVPLAPGTTLTFTMPVNVAPNTTVNGVVNNVSVVPLPPNCVGPACVTPPDCTAIPAPPNCGQFVTPGLTIKKSAAGAFVSPQTAGTAGAGVYIFTVKNDGRSPYTGGFDLNENLPSGFSYDNAGHPITGPAGYTVNCGSSTTKPVCRVTPPADIPVGTELLFTMPVNIAANTTVIDAANIVAVTPPNPNGPNDPNNPNDPKNICTTNPLPSYCGKYVISLLPLVVTKTANKERAEIGDTVLYTVTVSNNSPLIINDVSLVDILPAGFRYVAGTAQAGQKPTADPSGSPGPRLTFPVGTMMASSTLTYSYRVRIGVGAQQGDGTNQAQAYVKNKPNSNIARVKVAIDDGVFTQDGCLIGKVFADCNGNGIQDPGEPNIPKVRLYMDDGTYFITDEAGKYSFCGISPRTHVIKVDKTTLPPGTIMGITSNRNAHDPDSLFLDVKYGELIRGDFAVRSEPSGKLCAKPEVPPPAPVVGVERVPEPPKPDTAIEEISLSADALFDFDKWKTLKPAGKKSLDEFISKLQRITYEMMAVTGHTDWVGTHAYNDKLAMRRANTVAAYLRSQGVDVKRMIIQGRGKREPIATNQTSAGRALNRRVNVVMVGKYTLIHHSQP